MRIGIDSHAAEQDGTGNCTYFQNLILQLLTLDLENHYVLFVTDQAHPFYKQVIHHPNVEIVPVRKSPAWFRVYFGLPSAARQSKVDILHVQYFAPISHVGALVNTVHDLASYRFPQHFSRYERFLFRYLMPPSARKSRIVLTASATSEMDLISLIGLDRTKIRVTHCGVSDRFSSNRITDQDRKAVCSRYGLEEKFLLYVGRIDPRKNLTRMVEGFDSFRRQGGSNHHFAIVGKIYLEPASLKQTLSKCEFRNDIHFCGFVQDEDLPALYSAADAFLYPSEHEGFGLPPLEAMASGTPVIASDIPIFREILGDAALLIDPFDSNAIAESISRLISDPALQTDLVAKGRERAEKFNWAETARLTLAAYKEAGFSS